MKSILYLGILLMATAAIYGFVDYEHSVSQPAFDKLYTEEVMPVATEEALPVTKEQAIPVTKEQALPVAKEVPAPPSIPLVENVVIDQPEITPEMTKIQSLLHAVKESIVPAKKKKREREIDYKLFSRAPLREVQEIDETPMVEPAPAKQKSVQ